jgi:hypothetical protein
MSDASSQYVPMRVEHALAEATGTVAQDFGTALHSAAVPKFAPASNRRTVKNILIVSYFEKAANTCHRSLNGFILLGSAVVQWSTKSASPWSESQGV